MGMSMIPQSRSAKVQCWTSLHSHMGSIPQDRSDRDPKNFYPKIIDVQLTLVMVTSSYASAPAHLCVSFYILIKKTQSIERMMWPHMQVVHCLNMCVMRDSWMMPLGGPLLSGGSRGLCSLARVSDALAMKH
jgi:hypothetical protein